ncbi:restriction endonuclease subunit S [Caulobacter sp. ErkDOM-E]|uniref:restriction endonuclease subunit S n=1 Tax=Caulobacter sp. ErkDOM-E TaxID=3402778 RepID=UPI003AF45183
MKSSEMGGGVALVPKLRFPEFQNSGDWEPKRLGAFFSQREQVESINLRLLSLTSKEGVIPQEDSNRKNSSSSDLGKYLRVMPNDIVYNTMRMWEGRSALSHLEGIVSPAYTVCIPNIDANSTFFSHYFKTPQLIAQFARYSQGLVKDTLNLKFNSFSRIIAVTPAKLLEQQKIAECLDSMDALVDAQGLKVEALRTQKKGLMQQLFPQDGETKPRLRFPEFEGVGEWDERKVGSICDIQRGKFSHRPRNDPAFFGGEYPFIQTGDVVKSAGGAVVGSQSLNDRGLSVSKLFEPTIVLITIAANIGDTGLLTTAACFTDSVVGLIPRREVIPVFLELIMRGRKDYLNKVATTGAQKNINNDILREVDVYLPSVPEQQRISDCLTSLDDVIAAETRKLDRLKTHKKGLMQQLFPQVGEV